MAPMPTRASRPLSCRGVFDRNPPPSAALVPSARSRGREDGGPQRVPRASRLVKRWCRRWERLARRPRLPGARLGVSAAGSTVRGPGLVGWRGGTPRGEVPSLGFFGCGGSRGFLLRGFESQRAPSPASGDPVAGDWIPRLEDPGSERVSGAGPVLGDPSRVLGESTTM